MEKQKAKKNGKDVLLSGSLLMVGFIVWTALIQTVDVQPIGQNATKVGFAALNGWFHKLTGVHMTIYTITDWLGLIPIFVCMLFAVVGLIQLVKRRSLFQVDYDIIILGIYYIVVILGYLVFEIIPINYRPILIEGRMEASYPSSTTLLVLSVMPTLVFQSDRRLKRENIKKIIRMLVNSFSVFMVIGRLVSGVHWFTDIVGAVLLSKGLFYIYKAVVLLGNKKEN